VDVAVIGGGVTGLACARVLARAGLSVRVLEARRIGSGASGRNGGFALRGTSAPYDRARLPELMRLTEEALLRIRELAGDAFHAVGSLRVAVDDEELAALRAEHDALAEDGFEVEWRGPDRLPAVLRPYAHGGIFHPTDGAFEQGAWIRRLAALAGGAGARLAEDSAVTALDATSARTAAGAVRAGRLVVATDGYTRGLVPELDAAVVAVRGQVLATEPLQERLLPCPIYARWGYDYMQQLAYGRLVVGGRRDADLEGETTSVEETTVRIQELIEAHARSVFGDLPPVTHRWAGLMGFTEDYLPLVGELPDRPGIWVSVGYSGHGNVLGFACGEAVARAILGDPDPRVAPFSPGRIPAARPLA
jgi:gamma-glutamylputrescine oxidase